jgi:hypothetical protein
MLPDFLFSTYKQYKTDTDKITTWLAETAKKCGYKSPSFDPKAPGENVANRNGKPPKLKGRARKLARDAAATAAAAEKMTPASSTANANDKAEETKYTVPVREFEVMAEHIAKSQDASLKIPRGFINLMKRCIKTRRGTSDWFQENVPVTAVEELNSTDRHLHFANVLQRTLQTLLPVEELRKGDGTTGKQSTGLSGAEPVKGDLANAFNLLKVDEAEDEDFDPLTALVPAESGEKKASAPQRVRYVVDTEDDDGEEWFFALHCFFFDMHELRIFISVLWSLYKAGQIDLATVAVTTNTAYDLMRRAEDDFNKEMRIPKDYAGKFPDGDVVELYYVDTCLREGLEPKSLQGRSIVDFERWPFVQESFQLPYRLLVSFRQGINELGGMPLTRPASLGTYTPGVDRSKLSPQELTEQDSGLLMDFLTTIGPYIPVADTPNDDELMKGIEGMLPRNKGKIPLWLVVAAQSYLDIHHILMKDADRPLEDLQEFAREAQSTLKEHFAFLEEHSLSAVRTKKSEGVVNGVLREIEEWGLEDRLTQIMNKEIGKGKQRTGRSGKSRVWQPNELLKMHPLLAGMMKYSFHLQLQWEGIRLLNETEITTAAHLYNLLKQCGYLPADCEWEDMNLLIKIHGPQDIFLGGFPTTIEDCTKRLAMFQGVSPRTFARNRRKGGHQVIFSKTGGRALKQASPIASIFRNRFLNGGGVDFSIASVEVLLGRRMDERKKALDRVREFLQRRRKETDEQKSVKKIDQAFDQVKLPKESQGGNNKIVQSLSANASKHPSGPGCPEDMVGQSEPEGGSHVVALSKDTKALPEKEDEQENLSDPDYSSALTRYQKHHQLSIPDFLTELSSGLSTEQHLDLEYDYFAFFRRVWRLLSAIQTATIPLLQPYIDSTTGDMLSSTEGVPMVPGIIMLMACDPHEAPNMLALKNWGGADDGALRAAADVMRGFIEREGAVEAERHDRALERMNAGIEIDEETRRALDEIESIRDMTGAVRVDSDEEDEQQELEDELEDELDELEVAEAARRLLASTAG